MNALFKNMTIVTALAFSFCLILIHYAQAQTVPQYNFEELTDPVVLQVIHIDAKQTIEKSDVKITPDTYYHKGIRSYHGMLVSSALFNGDVYLADMTTQFIYRLNAEGTLERATGGRGRGPGEFLDLFRLTATDSYLFAQDRNQRKTLIFNKEMEQVKEIQTGSSGVIAAGKNYILVPGGLASNYFFEVRESRPPFEVTGNFFEHIIPVGMQPSGYRFTRAVANKEGDFIIIVNGLPFLFLFDEYLNHIRTIKLEGDLVHNILAENPPLEPVRHADWQRGGVHNVTGGLYLKDNRDILFSIRRTLCHLAYNDGSYSLNNCYQFLAPSGSESEDRSPIGIFDILFNEEHNELCFTSIHFANRYCYPFE